MSGAELMSNDRGNSKPGTAQSGADQNEKEDLVQESNNQKSPV